jgi:hypothetical protein
MQPTALVLRPTSPLLLVARFWHDVAVPRFSTPAINASKMYGVDDTARVEIPLRPLAMNGAGRHLPATACHAMSTAGRNSQRTPCATRSSPSVGHAGSLPSPFIYPHLCSTSTIDRRAVCAIPNKQVHSLPAQHHVQATGMTASVAVGSPDHTSLAAESRSILYTEQPAKECTYLLCALRGTAAPQIPGSLAHCTTCAHDMSTYNGA